MESALLNMEILKKEPKKTRREIQDAIRRKKAVAKATKKA